MISVLSFFIRFNKLEWNPDFITILMNMYGTPPLSHQGPLFHHKATLCRQHLKSTLIARSTYRIARTSNKHAATPIAGRLVVHETSWLKSDYGPRSVSAAATLSHSLAFTTCVKNIYYAILTHYHAHAQAAASAWEVESWDGHLCTRCQRHVLCIRT